MTRTTRRPSFYVRATDLEMLAWLAEYRLLQPKHFEALARRHLVAIRRRLRQFVEHGLAERLTLPLSRSRPVAAPPDQFVYRLGRRGARLLNERCGLTATSQADLQASFLEHELTIANFHVVLALATKQAPSLELAWRQSGLLDSAQDARGKSVSVNPDALFAVTNRGLPAEADTHHFFLEVERVRQHGYEGGESALIRKLRGYDAYAVSGGCQRTWNIDSFRVLVIVPTARRAANLRSQLIDAGLTSARFWLTDVARYALDRPASILGPICTTPADNRLHALMNEATTQHYESTSSTTSEARLSQSEMAGGQ